jgi:hypothetical protein
MRDLKLDTCEIALLKSILLFDPESKNLKNAQKVNEIREQLCTILSKYSRRNTPNGDEDSLRYAKLLMRLPPMRSWSLKGMENIFFIKAANAFDNILVDSFIKRPDF